MAARTTTYPGRRVNSDRAVRNRIPRTYEEGNTVRVLDELFEERSADSRKRSASAQPARMQRAQMHQSRAAVQRSRTRQRTALRNQQRKKYALRQEAARTRTLSQNMSAGVVLAITAVCIVTLLFCIHYLQLRSQVIHQNEAIAGMESTLSRLRADNDAYENKAQASLNMEDVKETALTKLGLHYATESQIRYYNADDESYVRQYEKLGGG